jgi:hypothetical protein
MASGESWWKITFGPLGEPIQYSYFFGTKANAVAQANLAVNGNLAGPFATKADAEKAKGAAPETTSPVVNAKNAITGNGGLLDNVLGLPQLSNLRNLVIRSAKVIVGMVLIAIGTAKLLHVEQAVKDVAPVAAKAALI